MLYQEFGGIRLGPFYADTVDLLRLSQIKHDPLRMQGVALTRETLSKIRITLPVTTVISICDSRESRVGRAIIPREAAVRQ
jgi:hypothetical protein